MRQIIHIINTHSDRYLAIQEVHDHFSASVKSSTIIQKYHIIREGEGYLNSTRRKITNRDDIGNLIISLGFPTLFCCNSSTTFIGRETYQKILEAKMMFEVVKLPHDSIPKGILNYIKPLENLNALLDVAFLSSNLPNMEV